MADEAEKCPQCNFPVFDPNTSSHQQCPPKKKFNKLFVIIPLIMVLTALITFAVTCFILPNGSNTEEPNPEPPIEENIENEPIEENPPAENVEETSEIESEKDICPAQEYGNHDWSKPTCIEPAHCYECGAYKDDVLGNHYFYYNDDIDEIVCSYCYTIKEE